LCRFCYHFVYLCCCWRSNYQQGFGIPLTSLTPLHLCACLKPGHGFRRHMFRLLGFFLCSVICGEISIKFRSQVSDYSIMKDSNLMSRMFYYNMLKMYVVMIKILLNFSQNWTQSLSLLQCIWIRGCKGLCSSLL
jgi:hypothetical protein